MRVIYENKNIMVVSKDAGITTTNEGTDKTVTVENWLKDNYEWAKKMKRGGVVHRLDKGTSGVLLIAKDNETLLKLQSLFKKRQVKKFYLALVGGDVSKTGTVLAPIKRSVYSFGKWMVDPDGKKAETEFKVLSKYRKDGKIFSLVEVAPKTGRTHQIRVHFKYLGWPLVGDITYGGAKGETINHPFLEAVRLKLDLGGEEMVFEDSIAADLEAELKYYEKI